MFWLVGCHMAKTIHVIDFYFLFSFHKVLLYIYIYINPSNYWAIASLTFSIRTIVYDVTNLYQRLNFCM